MNFKTVTRLAFLRKTRFKKQRFKNFWQAMAFFWLLPIVTFAQNYHAHVIHAEITRQRNDYILAADIEYQLSPQASEALHNGVPIFWRVKVKLQQSQPFWFDKTLLKTELRYRLQYHALLNMYRVKNENTNVVNNFSTLTAALNNMATVRDLPLISAQALLPNTLYLVAIKVIFEDENLPLPLQIQVIANKQWQLSSDWTRWNLPMVDAVN